MLEYLKTKMLQNCFWELAQEYKYPHRFTRLKTSGGLGFIKVLNKIQHVTSKLDRRYTEVAQYDDRNPYCPYKVDYDKFGKEWILTFETMRELGDFVKKFKLDVDYYKLDYDIKAQKEKYKHLVDLRNKLDQSKEKNNGKVT